MKNTVIEVVIPKMDQRLLNSSKRPDGPETPFMTTEKQMANIVCGMVAIAQIINVAETQ